MLPWWFTPPKPAFFFSHLLWSRESPVWAQASHCPTVGFPGNLTCDCSSFLVGRWYRILKPAYLGLPGFINPSKRWERRKLMSLLWQIVKTYYIEMHFVFILISSKTFLYSTVVVPKKTNYGLFLLSFWIIWEKGRKEYFYVANFPIRKAQASK